MEGIIIAVFLWLLFRAISRKARETQGAATGSRAGQNAGQAQRQPQRPQAAPQRRDVAAQPVRSSLTASPGNAGGEGEAQYSVIRPTVQVDSTRSDYSGSLSGGMREGISDRAISQEGMPSAEGEDTCDPSLDHARAQSMRAYAIHSGEGETQAVLPLNWTADELVKGFVFSEIIGKPRKWGDRHG